MSAFPGAGPATHMKSTLLTYAIVVGITTFGVLLSLGLRVVFDNIQRQTRLRRERAAAQQQEGFQKLLKSIQFYLEADGDTVEPEKGSGRYRVH